LHACAVAADERAHPPTFEGLGEDQDGVLGGEGEQASLVACSVEGPQPAEEAVVFQAAWGEHGRAHGDDFGDEEGPYEHEEWEEHRREH
jgi:hypothetical protein